MSRPTRQRPAAQSSIASGGGGRVGDQVAAASQAAAAAVPAARQARVVDPTTVIGTPAEQLAVYEAAIESATVTAKSTLAAAKARFTVEVGMALREIRDRDLYKVTHGSFELYVEQRLDIVRSRAYQLMDAAPVLVAMSKFLDTPLVESHARVLEPVIEAHGIDAAREVVVKAQENGKVTAAALAQARREAGYAPVPRERTAQPRLLGQRSALERLHEARERLARVSGAVTRTTVHEATSLHADHTTRLVRDLAADIVAIANVLGLTVTRDGKPIDA